MISRNEFLIKEIPQFHPASRDYREYWDNMWRYNVEGYWSSGYWMPGRLFFYVNLGTIELTDPVTKQRKLGRPWLRDTE